MTVDQIANTRRVLAEVAKDMKDDATQFDGKPFNGRTVAEYFGNQGAAIAALARAIDALYAHAEPTVHVNVRGETFTDDDLKQAGQDWEGSPDGR